MSNDNEYEFLKKLTRREVLRYGLIGGAGLMLPSGMVSQTLGAILQAPKPVVKAKSVIQLWMWGGPSHLDTFDPKPGTGNDFEGPFTSPIKTNVDGIVINELLPELAKIADKYSIIRSMTHGNNGHETAAYMTQTGYRPGDGIVHPGAGAVISLLKGYEAGYKGLIPPYIVLTQLLGRFSETGFLGFRAAPFATGGDPNQTRFIVEGVVAEGITDQRQRDRRNLLSKLDTLRRAASDDAQMKALDQAEAQAYDLILGDAGKVFDLSTEKDDVRTRYGKTTFGQSCLMARRLVEKGVPYIAINYGGWDTHKQHFQTMRRKLPEFDKAMAALIQDLSERGLLDSTIVWCGGEFGRTPKVLWEEPWGGGRGHYGPVFSSVVAGGGFKGGHVVGSSDSHGEEVKDRPVYPCDLIGSIYQLMGIDPQVKLPHPQGLDVRATPTIWDAGKATRLLKEIM
jgi:hypothetical protein